MPSPSINPTTTTPATPQAKTFVITGLMMELKVACRARRPSSCLTIVSVSASVGEGKPFLVSCCALTTLALGRNKKKKKKKKKGHGRDRQDDGPGCATRNQNADVIKPVASTYVRSMVQRVSKGAARHSVFFPTRSSAQRINALGYDARKVGTSSVPHSA